MNVSTRSWHYKLISLVYGEYSVPTNLCDYVKKLVTATIAFILMVCVLCIIGSVLVSPVLLLMANLLGMTGKGVNSLVTVSTAAGIVYLAIGVGYLDFLYTNRNNKKPSIIKEYYRSKKGKYCTKIKFTEE